MIFGGECDPSAAAVNLISTDDSILISDINCIIYYNFPQVTPKKMGDSHKNRGAILVLQQGIRFEVTDV